MTTALTVLAWLGAVWMGLSIAAVGIGVLWWIRTWTRH